MGLSLADHPALRRKLAAFRADCQLNDKPALVWHCRPMTVVEVDVNPTVLNEALNKDAVPGSDSVWWPALRSGQQPIFVYDGVWRPRATQMAKGGLPRCTRTGTPSLGFGLFQMSPSGQLMSVNADDNARHARQALILTVALRLALAQAIRLTDQLRPTGRTRLPTQHVAPASPATEIAGKAGIETG